MMNAPKRICPSCGGEVSDGNSIAPPRCNSCGELFSSLETTETIGSEEIPPGNAKWRLTFWILLPWLTGMVMSLAFASGTTDWIANNLPFNMGNRAADNSGWGLLVVIIGSSARLAYLRHRSKILRGEIPFPGDVIAWTIAITLGHIGVALGVLFAGCLVIAKAWH